MRDVVLIVALAGAGYYAFKKLQASDAIESVPGEHGDVERDPTTNDIAEGDTERVVSKRDTEPLEPVNDVAEEPQPVSPFVSESTGTFVGDAPTIRNTRFAKAPSYDRYFGGAGGVPSGAFSSGGHGVVIV